MKISSKIPTRSLLDGVYCQVSDTEVICADAHVPLRVMALRHALATGTPYRLTGCEVYPANIGHMLSRGPVAKEALFQDIGRMGRVTFRLPGQVVADGITSDIAIMDDPADKRYPRFVGRPNQREQWLAFAAGVRGETLDVTISLANNGSYVAIQMDAAHTAAHPWLWEGRLPADTCMGWLDALITAWLADQPAYTESAAAAESLRSAVAVN